MIDDVQFLLRNSVPDSAVLFVDSTSRDYVSHPTPSEYVIDLQEPIRNVFGMTILDAAIANTMYNVDANNNKLRVIQVGTAASAALQAARAAALSGLFQLTPTQANDLWDQADLNALNREFFAMGFASPLRLWLGDVLGAAYSVSVVAESDLEANPVPPAAPGDVPDPTRMSRCFVLARTIVAGVPMQCTTISQVGSRAGWFAFNGAFYNVLPPTLPEGASTFSFSLGQQYAILPSSSSALQAAAVPTEGAQFDVYTYRAIELAPLQYAEYCSSSSSSSPIVQLTYQMATATIEAGNYVSLPTLQGSLQAVLTGVGTPILAGSTSPNGIGKNGLFGFSAPVDCRYMFSTAFSTAGGVLGFDLEPSSADNGQPRSARNHSSVLIGGDAAPTYASVLKDSGLQVLNAPGLANLLGPRYITLRCPEIEQHIGTTGKYGPYSTGIGVFKLQSTNQIAQVRFDYVSLVNKPFHPIGRLQRLTLRFEMPDGSLYDFKGINNQLLISVKYYSPTPGADHALALSGRIASTLNPDYDPDYLRFMTRQTGYAPRLDDPGYDPYDEDDDEDRSFVDEDDPEGYDFYDDDRPDYTQGQEQKQEQGADIRRRFSELEMRRFGVDAQRAVLMAE